jgi:hypothetical protein
MVPPLDSNFKYNDEGPLRSWKVEQSFDTATECREMKLFGWKHAKDQHDASLTDEYMKALVSRPTIPASRENKNTPQR